MSNHGGRSNYECEFTLDVSAEELPVLMQQLPDGRLVMEVVLGGIAQLAAVSQMGAAGMLGGPVQQLQAVPVRQMQVLPHRRS